MEALLGAQLQSKDEPVATSAALADAEVVALYFSASWCPPCQAFTPELIKWYERLRAAGKPLEVVFVSSDKDESAFEAYYKKMPWLALPFAERDSKAKLSRDLKVRGIPTLAFANPKTGEVYSTDGRSVVMNDPEGSKFPWAPPSLRELLYDCELLTKNGKKKGSEVLANKHVGLYFSAHWCPPCKMFTPLLGKCYEQLLGSGNDWEVVFVSRDRSEAEFASYFGEMPWVAIPFEDEDTREALCSKFGIEGIPSLVQLSPDLELVNAAARNAVMQDPEGAKFPWEPEPVQSLAMGAGDINDMPALVALMEDESNSTQAHFEAVLRGLAEAHKAKVAAKQAEPMLFLTGAESDGITSQIRKLCELKPSPTVRTACSGDLCFKLSPTTTFVLLDIPDQGGFYVLDEDPSEEALNALLSKYTSGDKSDRKQMSRA